MFQWLKKIIYKKEEKKIPEPKEIEEKPGVEISKVEPLPIPQEKKTVKKTVATIDHSQYGKLISKLDRIENNLDLTAKQETLVEHDQRISLAISEITPGILKEIQSLEESIKLSKQIPDFLKQKLESRVALIRKTATKQEVYNVIREMILTNRTPYVHELEKLLVKSETNISGILSRATLHRYLFKLVEEGKLVKTGIGKFTIYRPVDMISSEEKAFVESVRREEKQ